MTGFGTLKFTRKFADPPQPVSSEDVIVAIPHNAITLDRYITDILRNPYG